MSRATYYDEALPFVANEASLVRAPGRQIDWPNVPISYGGDAFQVTLNGAVSVDATSITVDALPGPIPIDTLLHFGEAKEFVRVTAAAAAGATTLTVEAVPTALEDNDVAWYWPGKQAKKIPAGTMMAALSGGKLIPRAAVTGAETATSMLESTAVQDANFDHDTPHGQLVGGVIFENLLPDFSDAAFATWQGELAAAGVGTGWVWETYGDTTS